MNFNDKSKIFSIIVKCCSKKYEENMFIYKQQQQRLSTMELINVACPRNGILQYFERDNNSVNSDNHWWQHIQQKYWSDLITPRRNFFLVSSMQLQLLGQRNEEFLQPPKLNNLPATAGIEKC